MKFLTTILYQTIQIKSAFFILNLENNTRPEWTQSHEDNRSWRRMNFFVLREKNNIIFFSFQNVDNISKLLNFDTDRTKIAEVRAE